MVPAGKILETARKANADLIGLSGLITPSLDEMTHVAKEMEREGLDIPLLIGGATTSKVHTAVKIAPEYGGPTVHVPDASRSVTVVGSLRSRDKCDAFVRDVRDEYGQIRETHSARRARARILPIGEARRRKFEIQWQSHRPRQPATPGITTLEDYSLEELTRYIDWSPFFRTWELRGTYPAILDDETAGAEARSLFHDAQQLLARIVSEKLLTAHAVIGLFPPNTVGDDDIEIYADAGRSRVVAVLHHLRQQAEKPPGRPNLCLADFTAPRGSGVPDYIGAFAVTAGLGVDELTTAFENQHDDYHSIMTKALADRLAEAFAERLHERVRREFWGYAPDERLSNEELIREKYVGIRPAPGYPSCPDHSEKRTLFELLQVTDRIGIQLTDRYVMVPAASVCGWYIAHPDAFYFGVGKIGHDQVEDYAARTETDVSTTERWLAPNLGYEPATSTVSS